MIFLYLKSSRVHWWSLSFLILSKRIHSIYMLRMFNDCVAVFLGYLAIQQFTKYNWRFGCFLYSFSVSIKMNMLLQAPGILLVLLLGAGIRETVVCLSICAGLQIILGLPFLTTYPLEYLSRSFDVGRVFMFKWTVNWKFLSEEMFVSKQLSLVLLVLTAVTMGAFGIKWVREVM